MNKTKLRTALNWFFLQEVSLPRGLYLMMFLSTAAALGMAAHIFFEALT